MPYGRDNNIPDNGMNDLKKAVSEKLGGIDVNNIAPDQVKGLLVNAINMNSNIDPSIKEKINKGDIEGLKEEIIKYLSANRSADGSNDQLVNMLKNNDMEGLKRQIMGMLLSGMGSQKKNEVKNDEVKNDAGEANNINETETEAAKEAETENPTSGNAAGFDEKALMNMLFDKMFEGVKDDRRITLLTSIKPFVSDKRQKGIDDCIRIMNLVAFFENFMSKAGK
ncbi:MAG: hypothetical protein ACM3TR_08170 [Caulobacteraceae bacterium]